MESSNSRKRDKDRIVKQLEKEFKDCTTKKHYNFITNGYPFKYDTHNES